MLKASPNNSDDEDATPKVGNLFASFKAKTPTSADASTPSKISVASEIRQVLPLLHYGLNNKQNQVLQTTSREVWPKIEFRIFKKSEIS